MDRRRYPEGVSDADDPERVDDPDRAAILARRQRFVTLALSGLTGALSAGCDGRGATPQPCLEPARPPETMVEGPTTDGEVAPTEATTGPPTEALPNEAATGAAPGEGTTADAIEEGTTGPEGNGDETGGKEEVPEAAPRPCLRKASPRPCLKKAPPQPGPQPCLEPIRDPD